MDSSGRESEGVFVVLKHPAYQLGVHRVVIGGEFRANLDAKWYEMQCGIATKFGVDPYLFIAFSVMEYGGYRAGEDHSFRAKDRGLSRIQTGRAFVHRNGAAGVLLADAARTGVLCEEAVQAQLRTLDAPVSPGSNCHQFSWMSPVEKRDEQSFVLMRRLQDTALAAQRRQYRWMGGRLRSESAPDSSIVVGLQSFHGYGALPYLYRAGAFGDGLRVHHTKDGRLEPAGGRTSGLRGSEHPIYGYTLATFIQELERNAEVRKRLVPPNRVLPVTTAVKRDLANPRCRGVPRGR